MPRRVSAIDIGSNAIRMMVAEIHTEEPHIQILKKMRAPVRLGHDTFSTGIISEHTLQHAEDTFKQFVKINERFQVEKCRAVATSACREAKNKKEFQDLILKTAGIQIEIIDGTEEGHLIHLAVQKELALDGKKTMLIDVGGGSVEITFSNGSKVQETKSFPMGTVRVLENLAKRKMPESQLNIIMGEFLPEISKHIANNTNHDPLHFAIGTGGNLECLVGLKTMLLNKVAVPFLTLAELDQIIEKLKILSVKDRIEKLKLRPDRADVIVPSSVLVQTIMRQAEVEKIMIPGVGLRDGIIWSLL